MSIQVITLPGRPPAPPGIAVGYDESDGSPVVVTRTGAPRIEGARVVVLDAPLPPPGDGSAAVAAHIADATPHPVYDDLPSLSLIFDNGLV